MKFGWHQLYATDRFDLEDQEGRLVAWITRNRVDEHGWDNLDTAYVSRDDLGYITEYKNVSGQGAKYTWRLWWEDKDNRGHSGTDGINYSTMKEVKAAAEAKFLRDDDEVRTFDWSGNKTSYEDD